ncbi:MAG: type VI secretion system baseplate subunit TssG [Bacteroidota bacterium]
MNTEELIEAIEALPNDLRMEVLLGELVENQLSSLEMVCIKALGIFNRGMGRDLGEITLDKDDFGSLQRIIFPVHREGIYDALPKGLFHYPKNRKYKKTAKEIGDEVREQEKEEEAARNFFFPIEQEFFRQRILLELEERDLFSGFSSKKGRNIVARTFWGIDTTGMHEEKVTALLNVLPLSFTYKGNLPKVSMVMSAVLRVPLEMSLWHEQVYEVPSETLPSLGQGFLGVNMVLGSRFSDGIPKIKVDIGPLPASEISHFLPGRSNQRILSILFQYFLPFESAMYYTFEIREEDQTFHLDSTDYSARLGYSTYI